MSSKENTIKLSAVAAVISSIMGGFNAYLSNNIKYQIEENKRTATFSKEIAAKIENLANNNPVAKSKLTLAALYVMADDVNDKQHIYNLGKLSGDESLLAAATMLIGSDCTLNRASNSKDTRFSVLCSQDNLSSMMDGKNGQTKPAPPGKDNNLANVTDKVAASVTAAINSQQALSGYMYLGKAKLNKDGKLEFADDDRTTDLPKIDPNAKEIQSEGVKFKTITSVYLRTTYTIKTGSSIGVIRSNIELNTKKIQKGSDLKNGFSAYWAAVNIPEGTLMKN